MITVESVACEVVVEKAHWEYDCSRPYTKSESSRQPPVWHSTPRRDHDLDDEADDGSLRYLKTCSLAQR